MDELLLELREKVVAHINVPGFYAGYNLRIAKNLLCPFHKENNGSFRVYRDGSFHCFGCEEHGQDPVDFYGMVEGKPFKQCLIDLYRRYVETILNPADVLRYNDALMSDGSKLSQLENERGWDKDVIKRYRLGLKDGLLYIPIENKFDLFTRAVLYNVFGVPKVGKFLMASKGMPNKFLYPIGMARKMTDILLVEGFSDVFTALSHGFSAVTTGSAGSWLEEYRLHFLNKSVYIISDRDDPGVRGAEKLANKLMGTAKMIKVVHLPYHKDDSTDLTDWFLEAEDRGKKDLARVLGEAETFTRKEPKAVTVAKESGNGQYVEYDELLKPGNYNQSVKFVAAVAGRGDQQFYAPHIVSVECMDTFGVKKICKTCEIYVSNNRTYDLVFEQVNKNLLRLTDCTADHQHKVYRDLCRAGRTCHLDFDMQSTYALEKTLLTKPLKVSEGKATTDQIAGFYLGGVLDVNNRYVFTGVPCGDPKSSRISVLITKAEPVRSSIDSFELTVDVIERLKRFSTDSISERLIEIYTYFEQNITRIRKRFLLHCAIDLPFFSPLEFMFNGEKIIGPLDVLVFGDTRCGKTEIARKLLEYYDFGEMLSGENISFMNIVGGIDTSKKFRGVRFGRLAINHRGLVVIDEASALSDDTINKMSRVRSEGIAEVSKDGKHYQAPALCSKIWLSNPRDRRMMKMFSYGVEVVSSLFKQPEDIARIDYAIAVAADEVSSDEINVVVGEGTDTFFTQKDSQDLISWVRSRTIDQIEFDMEAVEGILAASKKLGRKYTNKIPLVQSENVRVKLARLSAAIAARVFSANRTGDKLLIGKPHVDFAVNFLSRVYSAGVMNYELYSDLQNSYDNLEEGKIIARFELLEGQHGFQKHIFLDKLLFSEYITQSELEHFGNLPFHEAKKLLGFLVSYNCLIKKYSSYLKTAPFIEFLRKQKVRAEREV